MRQLLTMYCQQGQIAPSGEVRWIASGTCHPRQNLAVSSWLRCLVATRFAIATEAS